LIYGSKWSFNLFWDHIQKVHFSKFWTHIHIQKPYGGDDELEEIDQTAALSASRIEHNEYGYNYYNFRLKFLAQHCPSLTSLTFPSINTSVSIDEALELLSEKLSLKITVIRKMQLENPKSMFLLSKFINLDTLHLINWRSDRGENNITVGSNELMVVLKNCTRIRCLKLYFHGILSLQNQNLLSNLPHLQKLTIASFIAQNEIFFQHNTVKKVNFKYLCANKCQILCPNTEKITYPCFISNSSKLFDVTRRFEQKNPSGGENIRILLFDASLGSTLALCLPEIMCNTRECQYLWEKFTGKLHWSVRFKLDDFYGVIPVYQLAVGD